MNLKYELFSTRIHPITRQEIDETTLPVGTLIRNVTCIEWGDHSRWSFQASQDGGKTYFLYHSFGNPEDESFGDAIIAGLKDFADTIEKGIPIEDRYKVNE